MIRDLVTLTMRPLREKEADRGKIVDRQGNAQRRRAVGELHVGPNKGRQPPQSTAERIDAGDLVGREREVENVEIGHDSLRLG